MRPVCRHHMCNGADDHWSCQLDFSAWLSCTLYDIMCWRLSVWQVCGFLLLLMLHHVTYFPFIFGRSVIFSGQFMKHHALNCVSDFRQIYDFLWVLYTSTTQSAKVCKWHPAGKLFPLGTLPILTVTIYLKCCLKWYYTPIKP